MSFASYAAETTCYKELVDLRKEAVMFMFLFFYLILVVVVFAVVAVFGWYVV